MRRYLESDGDKDTAVEEARKRAHDEPMGREVVRRTSEPGGAKRKLEERAWEPAAQERMREAFKRARRVGDGLGALEEVEMEEEWAEAAAAEEEIEREMEWEAFGDG